MNNKSVLKEKSFQFSVSVVRICKLLQEKKRRSVLWNQFQRSGTAVSALIHEAEYGQSKADFINKLSVALKEANESDYWLKLMRESGEIDEATFTASNEMLIEIIRMLVSSIRTAKSNLSK
jgi:four helix bundle protein